jgi:hypothetical protein
MGAEVPDAVMTDPISPMEVLLMPVGAIELAVDQPWPSERGLAVAALRQVLAAQSTALPLGPETAADDDGRLLSLNRFALQLVTSGIAADQFAVDVKPWAEEATAPQLLLAAQVDEENAVVAFGGVLTGPEFLALAGTAERHGAQLLLDAEAFKGGVERLLTLVQLLEPAALPRVALTGVLAGVQRQVVAIADWLGGQIDGALQQVFGAKWQPITQSAFFSGGAAAAAEGDGLALVAIPLGLDLVQLVCGQAAENCVERFVLQMVATGSDPARPDGLVLRLIASKTGDLLPDGLTITVRQGSHEQRQSASGSTQIELMFAGGDELIDVRLSYPGSSDLVLPPLQLPG